ncbi:uncharacterized protein Bfra_003202 [Botrytis fragariae]|uniref:Uncharacterized protein n=1 Tax=Botrytis fragariae TaxID=1964551 RepID=A0A8H6ELY5_9HELO|nr:uncharacterized protein Bfra_003202 [Botrytis fragariae]KAF5876795.1 hypothetical protein Bfra_003202 [Botrytis fragariae]
MNSPNPISKVIYWFWALFATSRPKNQNLTEIIVNQIKERCRKDALESRRQVMSTKQRINVFMEKVLLFMTNGTVRE